MADSRSSRGRYDGLAELARAMPQEPSSAQLVQGWQRLRAKTEKGSRWRGRGLFYATGFAVATAALVVGLRARRGADAALTYVVEGGTRGPAGSVASADDASSKLQFSDGTEFALLPHARATVGALAASEPHVAVDEGQVEVRVKHRENARWLVGAGPFTVTVTGTSFALAWTGNDRLEIRMHSGTVVVKGPMVEEGRPLGAGQSLSIRLASRQIAFGGETAETAPAAPPQIDPAFSDDVRAPPASHPHAPRGAATGSPGWSSLLARGKVSEIVSDAEARGVDIAVAQVGSDDLAALADASRYVRRGDIARRALNAQRARFPRSASARDAAFFLGRLDETDGSSSSAMTWYRRYLEEAPQGSYASEALGREMALVVLLQGKEKAVPLAERYLARFPSGPYAPSARSLLGRP